MTNHKQPTWFYTICLSVLTLGASLTLGLLSFSGFFAIWPVVPFAAIAFGLSVAYEGEIYYQNIKGALDKLFKPGYLEEQIALNYLLNYFPTTTSDSRNVPEFFKKYASNLKRWHAYNESNLTAEQEHLRPHGTLRKFLVKKMDGFENIFYQFLKGKKRVLKPNGVDTRHLTPEEEQQLNTYIRNCPINSEDEPLKTINIKQHFHHKLRDNRVVLPFINLFSVVVGMSMTLATVFLLSEAFALLPFLAAVIPPSAMLFVITPMAIMAGTAHGLLTYNTVTNLVINNTLQQRFNKLRRDIKNQGFPLIITSVALFTLAAALAVCTAGTWWTILQQGVVDESTFSSIIKLLIASVTGLSSLAFNLENTSATIDMINDSLRNPTNPFITLFHYLKEHTRKLLHTENVLQLINPFRLVIALTVEPLRVALFLGHLISIGVTADRMPGISKNLSALLGVVSECFEDWHYFFSIHSHNTNALLNERLGVGHHHGLDLPSRLVMLIVSPIYFLANLWNIGFSQFNQPEYQIEAKVLIEKPLSLFSTFVFAPFTYNPSVRITSQSNAMHRMPSETNSQAINTRMIQNNNNVSVPIATPFTLLPPTKIDPEKINPLMESSTTSTFSREQSLVSNEQDTEDLSELSGYTDNDDMSTNCSCPDHEFYFPRTNTRTISTKSTNSIMDINPSALMFCQPIESRGQKIKRIKTAPPVRSGYSSADEAVDISCSSELQQRKVYRAKSLNNSFFNPAKLSRPTFSRVPSNHFIASTHALEDSTAHVDEWLQKISTMASTPMQQ